MRGIRIDGCRRILGCAAIAALCVSPAVGREERVALEDLPEPVRVAAQKITAGGTLKHVELEREKGQDVYAVEAKMAGKNKEFTLAADGTLLAEEEDIALDELPEAGRTAAEKYFGGRSGLHASREIAGGVTSYEVEGKKRGKGVSLELNASGAIIAEETDDDEDVD